MTVKSNMKQVTHFKNTPVSPSKSSGSRIPFGPQTAKEGKKPSKLKVAGVITLSLLATSVIATSSYGVYSFFNKYELQSPLVVRLPYKEKDFKIVSPIPDSQIVKPGKQKTSLIPKAEAKEIEVTRVKASTPSDYEIASMVASYDWDYDTAIRIAKSENFWNLTKSFDCKRQGGVNSNGTRDHGLWQINDIHIKSGAITLEDALDCKKATEFAYGLYKGRGNQWTAWSAYNNGSYANHSVIEL